MLKTKIALVSLLLSAAMGSVGATTVADLNAQGLTALTGDEIRQLITGNTLDHKMAGTRTVAPIYYRADGTRTVNATAFGGRMYETKWWIENNQRCDISARTNGTQCGHIFKRADEYVYCIVGEDLCAWTFTLRNGNPDRLGE